MCNVDTTAEREGGEASVCYCEKKKITLPFKKMGANLYDGCARFDLSAN